MIERPIDLQPLFRRFHEKILLTDREFEELYQKSEHILARLREHLKPSKRKFTTFNQGSYELKTAVKPLKGHHDIDIGVVFDMPPSRDEWRTVKGWVHEGVRAHSTNVE